MSRLIPAVILPPELVSHLKTFSDFFPDKVRYEREDHSIRVTEEMPFELRVSISYFNLVHDIEDVMDNLELVLTDLQGLAINTPFDPEEGERRYFLLTKLFFYELLRIRDAIPRFLKRMEAQGLMSKDDRHSTRKLVDAQLSEHYLIRNAYLHGHSMPKSDTEQDLALFTMLSELGYEKKLVPLSGGAEKVYPELLQKLSTDRRLKLLQIATDMVSFCQNILNVSAMWVTQHHFEEPGART